MTDSSGPVSSDVLAILRCPACLHDTAGATGRDQRGKVALVGDAWLVCPDCGRRYPIVAGIPHMVVDEATTTPATPA